MMIFVLLLALPIILIFYIQTHKTKTPKNVHPPGPQGLPFIGNLHQFDGKYPHAYLHRLAKQYGPIISLNLGFRKLVVISSADVVNQIMKSYDVEFSSRPVLVSLQKLSYNGLDMAFSQYNDTWREMKKIGAIYLFSAKQLQSSRPILKDELAKMIKKIALNASLSKVVNLSEVIISFTNNTICRVAFGKIYGGEEHEKNLFFDLLHETQMVYFCEVCEQEIEPKLWYYGCHECQQYFHIDCIPSVGYLSKVKYGKTHVDHKLHQHPLTLTRMLTHGAHERCGLCKQIIKGFSDDQMAFHCSTCHFWVHFSCASANTRLLDYSKVFEDIRNSCRKK